MPDVKLHKLKSTALSGFAIRFYEKNLPDLHFTLSFYEVENFTVK